MTDIDHVDNYDCDTPSHSLLDGIDTPGDTFLQVNQSNWQPTTRPSPPHEKNPTSSPSSTPRYTGPIYLPRHVFDLLNDKAKLALQEYNIKGSYIQSHTPY
jgi:hypothetical protein